MFRAFPSFPMNKIAEVQARPHDFRLIERIPLTLNGCPALPAIFNPPVGDEKIMAILDFETTGLEHDTSEVIELGLVKVSYSPSAMRITAVLDVLSAYEEPKKPISELITALTGITDEMVAGKRIDDAAVNEKLRDVDLIVAHNASFDRPFFDRRFPGHEGRAWACSASGVDWPGLGFESRKLEYLLMRLGYFYEGHRAATDCLAVVWLLNTLPEALAGLIAGANVRTVRIAAFGAPFDVKDELKGRGYRWHDGTTGANKHWGTEINADDVPAELAYLDGLYQNASHKVGMTTLDCTSRFKGVA